MDVALITSAALLGLAGTPHCAAMCAAPCAAAAAGQGRAGTLSFHLARVASYGGVGALAAASISTLAAWSAVTPVLRPLWTMLHAGAFALGLWLLWQGRQPAWMGRWGRGWVVPVVPAVQVVRVVHMVQAAGFAPASPPARTRILFGPVAAGALWAAWPCGLLQSAVLVAALTGGAAAGASAMGMFALASSPGLLLGPWVWRRWLKGAGAVVRERALVRFGGALLGSASGWALSHDLWHRVALWCGLA